MSPFADLCLAGVVSFLGVLIVLESVDRLAKRKRQRMRLEADFEAAKKESSLRVSEMHAWATASQAKRAKEAALALAGKPYVYGASDAGCGGVSDAQVSSADACGGDGE